MSSPLLFLGRAGLWCALALGSTSALAGDLSVSQGRWVWSPARCALPQPPSALVADRSELPASALNGAGEVLRLYAEATQTYLDCVAAEAAADGRAVASAIQSGAEARSRQAMEAYQRAGDDLLRRQGENP